MSAGSTEAARVVSGLEAAAWTLCAALALLALAHTLGADFPARSRSLGGEMIVLGTAVALAVLALRRLIREDERRAGLRAILALVRMVLGIPLLLFALVAAASGFAA